MATPTPDPARLRDLVLRWYAAWQGTDPQAAAACFAPDASWHFPGAGPWDGSVTGYPAIAQRLADRTGGFDTWTFELYETMVNRDLVMSSFILRLSRHGTDLETQGGHLYRVRDGLIAEVWEFIDQQQAFDRLLA